uniref:Uncharacterized protein n=1 Tax=Brassica oleracea var. oleracea TaxID=109376 RepID=A0A0D3DKL5_BRAOL
MARSLRSDRAWLVRGLMVILELVRGRFGYVSVAFGQSVFSGSIEIRTRFYRNALRKDFFTSVVNGLLALLKLERDKIGAAPYDGCLRTLVDGIKPFVVRLGVKVLMTSFPARPLRSSLYVEVIRRVAADGILYGLSKLAGFLKTLEYWPIDKFWDLVSGCLILCLEMLETSVLGLGQDIGLIMALGGAMTTSTYVSCIVFDLLPSRFKVCDMFSAYVTYASRYCKGLVLALRLRKLLVCLRMFAAKIVVPDVFTQIAKDVVGRGLDRGTLTFKVIRPVTQSCSPGELARVTAELAGESTGDTVVLVRRDGSCRSRARRRVDRRHGRAHRAIWLVLPPSSPASRPATRSCSPGELARVMVELAGRSVSAIRNFYQIPSGVVFWIPSGNESAKDPPEGFFTCYEAFLVYCRIWFPIPGTIDHALRHFGLSISQLSVPALQHWLGVLILSYELGMDLNPGDIEGF